jgi:nucleotide-binding universal stress UspA family protein
MIEKPDGAIRNESREMFREILEQYQGKFKKGKLEYKLGKGKVFEEISKYARKIEADLIFTGTHGVTGFEEYWIGSNAYRIVTHAPCPVLTLRQSFGFKEKVSKILMPIDNTLQSGKKVFTTADIAKAFGASVHILALHSSKLSSLRMQVNRNVKAATEHLAKNEIEHKLEEISSNNITQDTIDYALNTGADLVSIMTEQETTQANVFLGTFARQLVNNCPVPVLSVRMTGR